MRPKKSRWPCTRYRWIFPLINRGSSCSGKISSW